MNGRTALLLECCMYLCPFPVAVVYRTRWTWMKRISIEYLNLIIIATPKGKDGFSYYFLGMVREIESRCTYTMVHRVNRCDIYIYYTYLCLNWIAILMSGLFLEPILFFVPYSGTAWYHFVFMCWYHFDTN